MQSAHRPPSAAAVRAGSCRLCAAARRRRPPRLRLRRSHHHHWHSTGAPLPLLGAGPTISAAMGKPRGAPGQPRFPAAGKDKITRRRWSAEEDAELARLTAAETCLTERGKVDFEKVAKQMEKYDRTAASLQQRWSGVKTKKWWAPKPGISKDKPAPPSPAPKKQKKTTAPPSPPPGVAGLGCDTIARMTTFTLKNKADKEPVDAIVDDVLKNATSKMAGFVGSDRYFCGGEFTYRLTTHWQTVADAEASTVGSEYYDANIKKVVPYVKGGAKKIHTQLFMYDKM